MSKIEEHFQGSCKANASMLMTKMMNAKNDGHESVRGNILKLIDIFNKLKSLKIPLLDSYLVHYIMLSLPVFDNYKINYNESHTKWSLTDLITKCNQEKERPMTKNKDK
jgi:hypothetical protein